MPKTEDGDQIKQDKISKFEGADELRHARCRFRGHELERPMRLRLQFQQLVLPRNKKRSGAQRVCSDGLQSRLRGNKRSLKVQLFRRLVAVVTKFFTAFDDLGGRA